MQKMEQLELEAHRKDLTKAACWKNIARFSAGISRKSTSKVPTN